MTQKIQVVIFDMDGVLVDSEPLLSAAAIAMFQEKGLAVQPEDFLPFVGAGEDRYIGGVAEKYHFPLDVAQAKKRTYEIYLDLVPMQLEAFPGVHALVHACRDAGQLVAIASGTDRIKVTSSLQKIGLPEKLWDTVVTGNDITRNKPAPDIFLTTARNLGVTPAACVVIEDSVNGIQAAKAAGMRCVAVAQTFPTGRLQEADVVRDRVIDVHLSDLAPELSNDL
jgi:beta-phosphoglucomutase